MKINKVHCLFEQSGTFKQAFLDNNILAFDYDLANDFGKTDFVVDLFPEIEKGEDSSIFNSIAFDDLTLAFFPCTYFEVQSCMVSRCDTLFMIDWDSERKLAACQKNNQDRFTYLKY